MPKMLLFIFLLAGISSAPAHSSGHIEGDITLSVSALPYGINKISNDIALENKNITEIKIYPNKTNSMLYIQSLSLIKAVYISDKEGKLMLTDRPMVSGKISIPVHELKNGIYLVRVNAEKGAQTYAFNKL